MDAVYKQGSLFSELYEPKKITKPIRLIECFAGIGSQLFDNKNKHIKIINDYLNQRFNKN